MKIALVSCLELPEPDFDEAPLLDALRDAGHQARSAAWDDPSVSWSSFDACVLRATWNYHTRPEAFLAWCDQAAQETRLLNGADAIRWNAHKSYLRHFEDRRIPIVPTLWGGRDTEPGDDPVAEASRRGWTKLVIKPAVSAGSRDTRVFEIHPDSPNKDAVSFARGLRCREDIMVQRFMDSVSAGGESSLVFIDGELSHAIQKFPRFSGQDEHVEAKPGVAADERRFAEAVLTACPFDCLYARVDIMRDNEGGIVLSELELIEPSLFFPHAPGSAGRMAAAIGSRLARGAVRDRPGP